MATNVHLTPELEAFARACVEGGMYNSVSEVVRSGLRLLKEQEDRKRSFDSMIAGAVRETDEKARGRWTTFWRAPTPRSTPPLGDPGGPFPRRRTGHPRDRRVDRGRKSGRGRGLREALDELATAIGEHPRIGNPETVFGIAAHPGFSRIRGFPYIVVYTPDRDPPLSCVCFTAPATCRRFLRDV